MASASATEYNIDNVYRAFGQVVDKSSRTLIRLPEFVNAFRELSKYVRLSAPSQNTRLNFLCQILQSSECRLLIRCQRSGR